MDGCRNTPIRQDSAMLNAVRATSGHISHDNFLSLRLRNGICSSCTSSMREYEYALHLFTHMSCFNDCIYCLAWLFVNFATLRLFYESLILRKHDSIASIMNTNQRATRQGCEHIPPSTTILDYYKSMVEERGMKKIPSARYISALKECGRK